MCQQPGFGVVLLVAVAVMTDYSNTLLVRTGVACGQASLEGTCAHLLGRKGFYLACVVMFFAGFGPYYTQRALPSCFSHNGTTVVSDTVEMD